MHHQTPPVFFTDNPTAMQSQELEDLTLLLVRDADEAEMWIDRWAVSYPHRPHGRRVPQPKHR